MHSFSLKRLQPALAIALMALALALVLWRSAAADASLSLSAVSLSAESVAAGDTIELRSVVNGAAASRPVDVVFRIVDVHGDRVAESPIGAVGLSPDQPTSIAERFSLSKIQAPGRYEAQIIVRAVDGDQAIAAAAPAFFLIPPPPVGAPHIAFVTPSTERAGEFITLSGDNLDGATAVKFGRAAATEFTPVSPRQIKVRVPDGVAAAAVTVVSPRGTAVSTEMFRPIGQSPVAGLKLAWHDEFDGDALDSTHWNTSTFLRHRDAINTPQAVRVRDGKLTLTSFTRDAKHYTGYLDSAGKYAAKFGYIEARMKFHDSPGEWSAFWMLNWRNDGKILNNAAVSGNEVDMAEHRLVDTNGAHSTADDYDCALSYNGYGGDTVGTQKFPLPLGGHAKIQDDWHIYGVRWTASGYTLYFDGRPQWTFTTPAGVSQIEEFLLLTSEIQNRFWAGDIPASGYGDADASSTKMEVDWVRVWQ